MLALVDRRSLSRRKLRGKWKSVERNSLPSGRLMPRDLLSE